MTIGEKVRELHLSHPDWSASVIAEALNVTLGSVRGGAHRARVVLPSEHLRRERLRESVGGARRLRFKKIGYAGRDPHDNGGW